MADTEILRQKLFQEMKGRIKEDNSSVPMPDGPFAYGTSFKTGGQQPRFFRQSHNGREEDILLDGDAEEAGKAYFRIAGVDHSPDHHRLVWGFDDKGSEFFSLKVRDAATKEELADDVPNTSGSGVWSPNSNGFYYTRLDDNHRPSKVLFHALGTDIQDDILIYEETDPGLFVGVGGTRLNDWILISINDHETSEYRVLPAHDPRGSQTIVSARETGHQYDLEEGGDVFFILTNADGAEDFKVMTAPADNPVRPTGRN